ncbi:ParB/RepB/Spo0J family partition protein [Synechococcus phage MinM1]|nr:ParB/RepB/Spo0J family partition protein [Synechococcus phage MinM1]
MDALPLPANTGEKRDIALDLIDDSPAGLRRTDVGQAARMAMEASVRAIGVVQPVTVRPSGDGRFILVDGRHRRDAARAAGLASIPAIIRSDLDLTTAAAVEAATNMVRANLAPVDTWRAVTRLQELGWTLPAAAEAMGLGERMARRLDKLGQLHPDVIAAIEKHGMPEDRVLAQIAAAPQDAQRAALEKHGKQGRPMWWEMGAALRQARIPRGRAIFDTDAAGVVFEEDLFAEPGSPEQWTTTDVAGFMAAQKAALDAAVEASGGRLVLAAEQYGRPKLPRGAEPVYAWRWPDALPEGCTGYVCLNGMGDVVGLAARLSAGAAARGADDEEEDADDTDAPEDDGRPLRRRAEPAAAARFTEKGLRLLAEMRTEAIRRTLRETEQYDAPRLLGLLLVALGQPRQRLSVPGADSMTMQEISAAAQRALRADDPHALRRVAAEAVAMLVSCDERPEEWEHGGPPAEFIGHVIGADAKLPRQDLPDLLAEAREPALRAACDAERIEHDGTEAGMRAALLRDWGPDPIFLESTFRDVTFEFEPPIGAELIARTQDECGQRAGKPACEWCGWTKDGTRFTCDVSAYAAELDRIGLSLEDFDPAEGNIGLYVLRAPQRDVVTRADPPPAPAPAPAAEFDCAWSGTTPCREDGTTRCAGCPRHARYAEWLATPAGRRARRAQENAEARATLKRARKKGATT